MSEHQTIPPTDETNNAFKAGMSKADIKVKYLGLQPYVQTFQAMQDFTAARTNQTHDEIWVLQHPSTYTQGRNGKANHLLNVGNIPVEQIDRGGQVTYHGPGQVVIYPLLQLERYQLNVRELVSWLEGSIIQLLSNFGISANNDPKAPGVYVDKAKIASIGLRVSRGYCYHGLALNVDMDLTPFAGINPCGFTNLSITQVRDLLSPSADKTNAAKKDPSESNDTLSLIEQHLVRILLEKLPQRTIKPNSTHQCR